jgi:hypothetical protein
MVLPVESIEERQDSAVNTLRETAQAFLAGQPVTNSTVRLVEMARHLAKVAAPPPLQEPEPVPKISRQQRRAVQRQAKKKR